MKTNDFKEEAILLEKLINKDIRAFAKLYKEYAEDLVIFAYTLTGDATIAINKVDELFIVLWEESSFKDIQPPIYNYLYNALRKTCDTTTTKAPVHKIY